MNYYTIKEVAIKLSLHEQTIRNWISKGKVKATKILGSTRISEEELKRMLKPAKPKSLESSVVDYLEEGEKIEIGDTVAGYNVIEKTLLYQVVEGELTCSKCKKREEELIAVKEKDEAYCNKCFFDRDAKLWGDSDYVNICLIRNKI